MTTESNAESISPWWKYGPSAAGGFCSVLLTFVLARWLPRHFAAALAWSTTWFLVAILFGKHLRFRWQLPLIVNAILLAAGTGIAAGVMSYFLQWP